MRIVVAFSSSRCLEQRLASVRGIPGVDSVVAVDGAWARHVSEGDIVVVDHFSSREELALAAPKGVMWLHILSSGVDSFALDRLNIPLITRSKGSSAGPISEWVIAMMLAREKQLSSVLAGRRVQMPLGELGGKTLAVFGMGAIGGAVAHLALAFGMHVIGTGRDATTPARFRQSCVESSSWMRW
jgi:phosphoglycerate dehydrogenase-like enzyme